MSQPPYQSKPPTSNDHGSILPVPDVEATPHVTLVTHDEQTGMKRWLVASLISAGVLALAGIVVFAVYAYVTSTPKYVLSAALTNFVTSEGQAGSFSYDVTAQNRSTFKLDGDFLTYSDPTNDKNNATTISFGHNASRVGANIAFFANSNAVQFVGLGNIGRLLDSVGLSGSFLGKDALVRLSNLDGQWYSQTADDIWQLKPQTSQHTLQGAANSSAISAIGQLYVKYPFITVAKTLSDEQIDGANTMHIQLGIDRNKLSDYLHAVKTADANTIMLTDDDINKIATSDTWNRLNMEVWIARSDRTFRQVRLTTNESQDNSSQTMTVTFHNEQVATARQAVAQPDNVKSFSTFVDQITSIVDDNAKTTR